MGDTKFPTLNDFADSTLDQLREGHPNLLTNVLGSDLLWERSVELDFSLNTGISFNKSCRLISAQDGPLAFNLAREEDWSLLPALLEAESRCVSWTELEFLVQDKSRRPLLERARLMGLPVSIPFDAEVSIKWQDDLFTANSTNHSPDGLKVLDFSSLWAGPLCSHLLLNLGCKVVKVESRNRRDISGSATPRLFSVLNKDKELLIVDFQNEAELESLRQMICDADIVIEGSRPRAFEALGIDRRSIRSQQTSAQHNNQLWLSLTAYGRFGAAAEWVGFGDDVAASAGVLDRSSDGGYGFVGDAIADPLAGLQAALTVKECLTQNLRGLLDFSLFRAARIALETVERLYDSPLAPLKKVRTRC